MSIRKIGVVGVGCVGSALKKYYEVKGYDVLAYDKDPSRTGVGNIEDLKSCDVIFVSVPTLTLKSGVQDQGPLIDVMRQLSEMNFKGIVIHKCTVTPGTTHDLKKLFSSLRIVHSPEFLTERNAYEDLCNAPVTLMSGNEFDVLEASTIVRFPIFLESYAATEIAKYMHNCFLAIKVSFMNEMFDVCEDSHVLFDEVVAAVKNLGGIGETHLRVPGPDGKRGYGGMCFPKDTQALFTAMSLKGLWMHTLAGAMKTNKLVRDL